MTATFLVPGVFGGVLPGFIDDNVGVYWGGWNSGQYLGTQVVGTLAVLLWSAFWSFVVFLVLKIFGVLVLQKHIQVNGLAKTAITQKGYAHSVWLSLY